MSSDNQPMTWESFQQKVELKHGNRYKYDNFIFTGRVGKSWITCRIHGDFLMTPKNHVRGQGCRACGSVRVGRSKNKITHEDWLERFKAHHGGAYTYQFKDNSRVFSHDLVVVKCPAHGEYSAKAYAIAQGSGCKQCKNSANGEKRRWSTEKFIEESRKVHGARYEYDCTEYVKSNERLQVRCRVHGLFECIPSEHLAGTNCMQCSRTHQKRKAIARGSWLNEKYFRANPDVKQLPYRLYLLRMNDTNGEFVKVGITTNDFIPKRDRIKLLRRMCNNRDKFQSLIVLENTHYKCWKAEQDILNKYSTYRYHMQEEFAGHTECFSIDCLEEVIKDFKLLQEIWND